MNLAHPLILFAILPIFGTAPGGGQEESLKELVRKFVEGDDSVREKILEAGPAAMRELFPHRGKRRIDELRSRIRLDAATEADREVAEALKGRKVSINLTKESPRRVFENLQNAGLPAFPDLSHDWGEKTLTVQLTSKPSLVAVERISAMLDMDFAFHYGFVVVAPPDRLWPREPVRIPPLDEEARKRARECIEQLGADSLDDRAAAAEALRELGPAVIPLLEKGRGHEDPEVAARCADLARQLRPPAPRGAFGAPAASRQKLEGKDAELYSNLRVKRITFKVKDLQFDACLKLLLSQFGEYEMIGEASKASIAAGFETEPFWRILSLFTQSFDLDFMVRDGKVLVGPRDEIEKRLGK